MRKWRKRLLIGLGALVGLLAIAVIGVVLYVQFSWDRRYDRPVPEMTAPDDPMTLARGEYIFKYTALCWACHGPEEYINAPPAGGREFDLRDVGPPTGLGVFYASNLTPDQETGLGDWSDGEIIRALRQGIDREGRVIILMPFEWYRGMSDEDLLAIVAYIRSLPPVHNPVPDNRPSPFFKGILAFKFIKPEPLVTEPIEAPARGLTIEYGKYLSSNLSSCGECHTPRNLQTGRFYMDRPFTGGNVGFEDFEYEGLEVYARNLTPDRETGIGDWSEDDFLTAIRTGIRPDGTVIMPKFMPWLIYGDLSEDDLRAIYRYLRSLPPESNQVPAPEVGAGQTGAVKGRAVFQGYCSSCHGSEGSGTFISQVPLRQVASTMDPGILEQFIRNGVAGTIMPGFAQTFNSEDLSALLEFLQTWEVQ
ncbi:MAG: c-type cytochrome [Dehalococcoidia bacterium]